MTAALSICILLKESEPFQGGSADLEGGEVFEQGNEVLTHSVGPKKYVEDASENVAGNASC